MEDLLGHFLGEDAGAVLDEIEPGYGIIPDDPAELDVGELIGSTFSRMSQTVGELHVRGYFDIATTAANACGASRLATVRVGSTFHQSSNFTVDWEQWHQPIAHRASCCSTRDSSCGPNKRDRTRTTMIRRR